MQNNKELHISIAGSRKMTSWPRTSIMWSEFIDRLKIPVKGSETFDQYIGLPKSKQDELKDVGGFVGGTFLNDRRKAANVEGRDLITLDMDNIETGGVDNLLKRIDGLGCAAVVYSTRKHCGYAPRVRVIIPVDRTATADEYEPCARKLASLIGIELCDPTTFEASRLMYWPSCCSDSTYICKIFDKPFCNLDGLLGLYEQWRDVTQWPQVPGHETIERRRLAKQEDPTCKKGIIGAFCRTYTIVEAMNKFIPGMYEDTSISSRYTYVGGSTVGGAVVYEGDKFLYSHHATDPCSGLLVNAFDLIRLHMFGDKDDCAKEGTPTSKLPSFVAMSQLAVNDPVVSDLVAKERFENAKEAFSERIGEDIESTDTADFSWLSKLTKDHAGNYEKTINNMVLILENDPLLKGKIATDEFASCGMVMGSLPWDNRKTKRRWVDADDAEFYRYMETFYGLTGREKLDNSLIIISSRNKINEVRDYLKKLKWDGIKRLDTLLSVYLGADDNAYTRAVIRKSLCAAVGRAIVGGIKYDHMPIFTGPQGVGKSTFLAVLGLGWFSDSLTTFDGKEAAELIQGTWINEIGELTAMTKTEATKVKQFLSKREDIYRAAYGRRTDKYLRRCVFFGTSNEAEFLKDTTGNRRFWPVDVGVHPATKSVWNDLANEVNQIWAEAYLNWALGEPLYLSGELEVLAKNQQENHREMSAKEGMIRDYLNIRLPLNWDDMDVAKRKMFLSGGMQVVAEDLYPRDKVCAVEVWVECFNGDIRYMKRMDSAEINGILANMDEWKRNKSVRRYGPYGTQRGFERCKQRV